MADDRKYYYLRLKDNFFESDEIIILESMPDGYLYSNILLKLYLRSLKYDGRLMFNDRIPFNSQMLATITRHNVGVIEKAMLIFKDLNLIEILDSGAIYVTDIQNFIGKSSSEADRKRLYREQIEKEKSLELRDLSGDLSGDLSKKRPDKSPPEIEIEIEIEKEIEIECQPSSFPVDNSMDNSVDNSVDNDISNNDIVFEKYFNAFLNKTAKESAYNVFNGALRMGVNADDLVLSALKYNTELRFNNSKYQMRADNFIKKKRFIDFLNSHDCFCEKCHGTGYFELKDGVHKCKCTNKYYNLKLGT